MTLTVDQIASMPAGPRLDTLVAQSLGWAYVPESYSVVKGMGPLPRFAHYTFGDQEKLASDFHPSRNWSDAMFAAESVGLLKKGRILLQDKTGAWAVDEMEYGMPTEGISSGETGPLAVSRAIAMLAIDCPPPQPLPPGGLQASP